MAARVKLTEQFIFGDARSAAFIAHAQHQESAQKEGRPMFQKKSFEGKNNLGTHYGFGTGAKGRRSPGPPVAPKIGHPVRGLQPGTGTARIAIFCADVKIDSPEIPLLVVI